MKTTYKYLLGVITLLILLFQSTIFGQTLESKIDSLLSAKYNATSPGAVFLVAKNGNIL